MTTIAGTTQKSFTCSRGLTYAYYWAKPVNNQPIVFLAHGWPDSAKLWQHFISTYLVPAGLGVLAIDALGYGGSSKPENYEVYRSKLMAHDIKEILESESISKVIGVGHDWGSFLVQRFYLFHREMVEALVIINVSYVVPGIHFELERWDALTQNWYWNFMIEDRAPALMDTKAGNIWDLIHSPPEVSDNYFRKQDAFKNYIIAGDDEKPQAYATDEMKAEFVERLSRDGFDAPAQWYRAMAFNIHYDAEKSLTPQEKVVTVPVFFFGGTKDTVCSPQMLDIPAKAGLLPHLFVKTVEAGHWPMLEKPDDFGKSVVRWINGLRK